MEIKGKNLHYTNLFKGYKHLYWILHLRIMSRESVSKFANLRIDIIFSYFCKFYQKKYGSYRILKSKTLVSTIQLEKTTISMKYKLLRDFKLKTKQKDKYDKKSKSFSKKISASFKIHVSFWHDVNMLLIYFFLKYKIF